MIGALIKDTRKGMGLSQAQLAKLCGWDKSYQSRIEAGANITLETLNKISKAFCKSLSITFK